MYIEIDPGKRIGSHKDNVEEIVVLLNGSLKIYTDFRTERVDEGEINFIPSYVNHTLENTSNVTSKIVSLYPTKEPETEFNDVVMPYGKQSISLSNNMV